MSEQDVNNFSSSPHRLPTISASQALQDIAFPPHYPTSTGLQRLDRVLCGNSWNAEERPGGLPCGQITEIHGPPGVGKTTLSLQAAANALLAGGSVAWVDTSYVVNGRRLKDVLDYSLQGDNQFTQDQKPKASSADMLGRFHHLLAPTLPHLIALLIHSTATFPPEGATLLVVDSVSTPFIQAFARSNRHIEDRASGKKGDAAQWASGRRWAVMGDLISALGKLAATRNIAIVLTSQTTTKMKMENAALLQAAMLGTAWDSGISSRILLYRDWQGETEEKFNQEKRDITPDLRFAAAIKIGGVSLDGFGEIVQFTIGANGISEVKVGSTAITMPEPAVPLHAILKRKRDEVADSASDSGDEISDDGFSLIAEDALMENKGSLD